MHLSVFDLDHTLLKINSSFEFYSFLRKKKIFSPSSLIYSLYYLVRYLYLKMSPVELHHKIFQKFLKGRRAQDFLKAVDLFWDNKINFFYEPALSKLKEARKRGHYVLILSNSPDFLIGPIIKKLEVDSWMASRYDIDEEGKFSTISKIMDGVEKAKVALTTIERLKIDKEDVSVYSDSIWDLPLLKVAGTVVAVNPDKELLSLSKKEKWAVI